MTNGSGAVTASLTLSAFGQTVTSTGSSTSAYQYGATSGYRTEGDSRLTLVGCRFYDAQVGRFITRDTYLNQKPYAYCDGEPVNATDPTGHFDPVGDLKAGGAGGAIAGILIIGGVVAVGGVAAVTAPVWGTAIVVGAVVGAAAGWYNEYRQGGSPVEQAGGAVLGGGAGAMAVMTLRGIGGKGGGGKGTGQDSGSTPPGVWPPAPTIDPPQ